MRLPIYSRTAWAVIGFLLAFLALTEAQAQRPGNLRREGTLKVGDPAPSFKLRSYDGKSEVQLSSFQGKRPVVLVFGSST